MAGRSGRGRRGGRDSRGDAPRSPSAAARSSSAWSSVVVTAWLTVTVMEAPAARASGQETRMPGALVDTLEAALRVRDRLDRRPPEVGRLGQARLDRDADRVVALGEGRHGRGRPAAVVAAADAVDLEPGRGIAATAEQHDRPFEPQDRLDGVAALVGDRDGQRQARRTPAAADDDGPWSPAPRRWPGRIEPPQGARPRPDRV